MRKRGWRTPEWKLIRALEPDIYAAPDRAVPPPQRRGGQSGAHPPGHRAQAGRRHGRLGGARLSESGLPDPSVAQADALRIWQPRFIARPRRPGGERSSERDLDLKLPDDPRQALHGHLETLRQNYERRGWGRRSGYGGALRWW